MKYTALHIIGWITGTKITHKLSLNSSQFCTGYPRTTVPVLSVVHVCTVSAARAHHFSQQWHQHVSVQWTVGVTGVKYNSGYWFISIRRDCQACLKVSNFSNLWFSADARRELFRTIQFYLVYWFDRFTKKNRFKRTIRSRTGHVYEHYSLQRDGGGKRKGENWGVEAPQIHK